jgi:hypothetical protein
VGMSPREAFPGYDEPVNINMEPEDALKALLGVTDDEETDEPAE